MQELLLAWYSQNGRDLPWRHTHDPYAILVSEVMLQQTQVSRVVAALPGLARALAGRGRAGGRDAGRGDPRPGRGSATTAARSTCTAARRRSSERGGFPRDQAQLRALPGIGPYTAAAIACFAFGDAGGRARHQRPPRARPRLRRPRSAATARPRLRVEPGPVRPGQRRLHRPPPALRALPAGGRLPVGRHDVRPAAQAVALRGIVPPAPKRRAQAAGGVAAPGRCRRWTTARRWTRWSPTAWQRWPAGVATLPALAVRQQPVDQIRQLVQRRDLGVRANALRHRAAATGSATPPSIP